MREQTFLRNPIKEDRKFTNGPFIAVFLLLFLIWLTIVIKAPGDDLSKFTSKEIKKPYRSFFSVIEVLNFRYSLEFLVCTILSGVVAVFYTYFLSLSVGKYVVYITVFLICMLMILVSTVTISMIGIILKSPVTIWFLIGSLLYSFHLIISFRCALSMGHQAIFNLIRDSCRSICHSSVLIIAIVVSLIIVLVLIFTVSISNYVLHKFSGNAYFVLNLFAAKALINFFVNFIHIVVSGYVIEWFWMKEEQSNLLAIRHSFGRTIRFHLGTIAFSSIPFLSHILSLMQTIVCRKKDNVAKKFNIFTRFFSQVSVFMNIEDFALIQTSIYGYDYSMAITAAHDLVSRNNHELNLAILTVSSVVAAIGSILMTIPFFVFGIQHSIYSPLILFYVVFTSAVRAILVNKMIIQDTNENTHEIREQVVSLQSQNDV